MESFFLRGDKALCTRQLKRLCQTSYPYYCYHYAKFSSAATISSPINEQLKEQLETQLLLNRAFTPEDRTLLKTVERRLHIENVRRKSIFDDC